MKRTWLIASWIIAVLLALSTLYNSFLVYNDVMLYRDIQNDSNRLANGNQLQAAFQSLVQDLVNYGHKEPSIFIVLKKYGVNPPSSQSSTPSPATSVKTAKPLTKNNRQHN